MHSYQQESPSQYPSTIASSLPMQYLNPSHCSASNAGVAMMPLTTMPQPLPSPTRSGRRQSPRPLILSPSGNTSTYSSTTCSARQAAAPYPAIHTHSQQQPRSLGGRRHSATSSQVAPSLTAVPTSAPLLPGSTWLVPPQDHTSNGTLSGHCGSLPVLASAAAAQQLQLQRQQHPSILSSAGLLSPTYFSTSYPASLSPSTSADTLSQLPTPTSPAGSSSLGSKDTCSTALSPKRLYSLNEETGMLTCHACAKVMPLSRRPRGSPCLQYTIRYHEQTTQHSICAAGFFLWHHRPAAARPTSYAPPPNLARYSGNLTLTALECLVYNPLYSVTRTPTAGEKVITCHVCNQHFGGAAGAPPSPTVSSPTTSVSSPAGMDLVSATVAHESSQQHERAIFACAMRLVRRWGRLVVHQPSGEVQDVVISDKEREWFAERMAATALVEIRPRAASNASLNSLPASGFGQPQQQQPMVVAPAADGSLMSPTFLDAGYQQQQQQQQQQRFTTSGSPAAEDCASKGLTPLLGTGSQRRPFPPPVAPGRGGAMIAAQPPVGSSSSTSPPLGPTRRIRVTDLLN